LHMLLKIITDLSMANKAARSRDFEK